MSNLEILTASPTGLCFGVQRAIKTLEQELKNGTVYAIGSPIHNPQETHRLEKLGLIVVETPSEVPQGAVCFIRAHGITPQMHTELEAKNARIVDGTCPFVKNAQEKAKKLSQNGYSVVILGDVSHPEIVGINGYAGNAATVLTTDDEVPKELFGKRIGFLSQTTQRVEDFCTMAAKLTARSQELCIFNTVCKATLERQQAVQVLTKKTDGVIVLGGRNSANTRKLVEISSSRVSTIWIEHADELDKTWLEDKHTIGIAAGGSTPDWLIQNLILTLHKSS